MLQGVNNSMNMHCYVFNNKTYLFTLFALQGHLLLVGGLKYDQEIHHYDPETRQWRECGQLPVGVYGSCCAVLPSGDVMVGPLRENVDRKH